MNEAIINTYQDWLERECVRLHAEIDRLKQLLRDTIDAEISLADERDALRAENGRLRNALEEIESHKDQHRETCRVALAAKEE